MPSTNPFTEEGRTRFKNFQKRAVTLLLIWLFLGLLGTGGYVWHKTTQSLRPLQSLYFRQYLKSIFRSSLPFAKKPSQYVLLVRLATNPSTAKDVVLGVNDEQAKPLLDDSGKWISSKRTGPMFRLDPKLAAKKLYWTATVAPDEQMNVWLRANIYEGAGLIGLFYPGLVIGGGLFGLGSALSIVVDRKVNRRYAEGELIRGTRKLTPKEFCREMRGTDLGISIEASALVSGRTRREQERRDRKKIRDKSYPIGTPRCEESEHAALLGDSGTGKSQLIHHLLDQLAGRASHEAAIIYDPACEFMQRHFRAERGDIILNPLDARCPYWSPVSEISLFTDRMLISESFFPGHHDGYNATAKFFTSAGRDIFGRVLELNLSPEQMVELLKDAAEIDRIVAGTECAHYIDHGAGNQRGGVLATLAEGAGALKLLPRREDGREQVVLSEWARRRRGWIFITSTKDTRDALRPLHAALLDLLMKRLMSVSPEWGRAHPCWTIIDEVHALKRLPALHDALSEGRKYGLKIVLGTQSKNDFEEYYGKLAKKMLAIPHTKFFFRTNESESAKWVADMIGEAEHERTKIGTTASVEDKGRDAINYSTQTERRAVISKEEVMAMPGMQAYLKYADMVVPFRFEKKLLPITADGFIPRKGSSSTSSSGDAVQEADGEEENDQDARVDHDGRTSRGSTASSGSDVEGAGQQQQGGRGAAAAAQNSKGGNGAKAARPATNASAESEQAEEGVVEDDESYAQRRSLIASARAMLEDVGGGPEATTEKLLENVIPISRGKKSRAGQTAAQPPMTGDVTAAVAAGAAREDKAAIAEESSAVVAAEQVLEARQEQPAQALVPADKVETVDETIKREADDDGRKKSAEDQESMRVPAHERSLVTQAANAAQQQQQAGFVKPWE